MTKAKPAQKLINFTKNSEDFYNIKKELNSGWNLVSLSKNGIYYIGIIEKNQESENQTFFIPPRKKIKILKR